MKPTRELHGATSLGLYLFAATLVFWPLADLTLSIYPLQPADLQWRYGAIGLLSSYLHTPMIGGVLAGATAWYTGHAGVLRTLSFTYVLAALALLAAMAVFGLDLPDVVTIRPPEMRWAVLAGGTAAEAKMLSAAVVLALLGVGGIRMVGGVSRTRGTESSPGVVARASADRV